MNAISVKLLFVGVLCRYPRDCSTSMALIGFLIHQSLRLKTWKKTITIHKLSGWFNLILILICFVHVQAGFTGIGVGAAYHGLRPIVEFMTFNFSMQVSYLIMSANHCAHWISFLFTWFGMWYIPSFLFIPFAPHVPEFEKIHVFWSTLFHIGFSFPVSKLHLLHKLNCYWWHVLSSTLCRKVNLHVI